MSRPCSRRSGEATSGPAKRCAAPGLPRTPSTRASSEASSPTSSTAFSRPRPDGRAHASPVAFSVEGGAFWIATVLALRVRSLRAVPWASFVLSEGQREGAHRALTAEGPVRLHEDADFASARARLDDDWARRHGHAPDWASAFVELRPERVFSHRSR